MAHLLCEQMRGWGVVWLEDRGRHRRALCPFSSPPLCLTLFRWPYTLDDISGNCIGDAVWTLLDKKIEDRARRVAPTTRLKTSIIWLVWIVIIKRVGGGQDS